MKETFFARITETLQWTSIQRLFTKLTSIPSYISVCSFLACWYVVMQYTNLISTYVKLCGSILSQYTVPTKMWTEEFRDFVAFDLNRRSNIWRNNCTSVTLLLVMFELFGFILFCSKHLRITSSDDIFLWKMRCVKRGWKYTKSFYLVYYILLLLLRVLFLP